MDHAVRMSERDGIADLEKDGKELGERCRSLGLETRLLSFSTLKSGARLGLQNLSQLSPFHQLHREIEITLVVPTQFVDGHNVRVLQLARHLCL